MFAWEPHNDLCDLCLVVGGESSGGRPKRKRKGRPRDDDPTFQRRKVIGKIGDIDSPEFANFPLDRSLFLPSPYLDDLSCYNCHCIANQPVEVTTCLFGRTHQFILTSHTELAWFFVGSLQQH